MLIDTIVNYCNDQYKKKKCNSCTYEEHCPDRCDRCLHYIHTPTAAPAPRQYDCPNMANFYTCKYSYKYMSELIYALERLKDLRDKKHLRVMSIGCGPTTDLFALDYLKEIGVYQFETLEFRGVDSAKDVWMNIHKQTKLYNEEKYNAKFYYKDITELINTIVTVKWVPDLIVFQYVFSDMEKYCPQEKLRSFISKIGEFINSAMDANTYTFLTILILPPQRVVDANILMNYWCKYLILTLGNFILIITIGLLIIIMEKNMKSIH